MLYINLLRFDFIVYYSYNNLKLNLKIKLTQFLNKYVIEY